MLRVKNIRNARGRGRIELGHLTAELRRLPDFLIIGTQKGGTTSLYNYLIQHPDIGKAARKEVHYFDRNYERGVRWYKAFFPTRIRRHIHEQKTGRILLSGEATPEYLFHPEVPRRAKSVLPEVQIIVLLRDPIDRAFSHYNHMVARGLEKRSFGDAIEVEASALDRGIPVAIEVAYLSRGFYAEQLDRWSYYYERHRLLIIKSADFFSNPRESLTAVFAFLNLDQYVIPDAMTYNAGRYPSREIRTDIRNFMKDLYVGHNDKLNMHYDISF